MVPVDSLAYHLLQQEVSEDGSILSTHRGQKIEQREGTGC